MLARDLQPDDTTDFRAAAAAYLSRGWVTNPLGLDDKGLPKRPFVEGWQKLTLNQAELAGLPWERARGIGIVLGAASGNLGVIDIDDQELAREVAAWLVERRIFSFVWTVRRRLHVYVLESEPSKSRSFKVAWRGRQVQIELKASGTQVAAPPTPGYVRVSEDAPIWKTSLVAGWTEIAQAMGFELQTSPNTATQVVPSRIDVAAALEGVQEGTRDDTLFRLASKFRHAGLPREIAELLILQTAAKCTPPFSPEQALAKVQSAYSRYPAEPQPNLQPSDQVIGGQLHEESGAALLASEEVEADLTYLPLLGSSEHLVVGWSHLVAGYPRSGKTELLVRLVQEWLTCGHSVLYVTEEPRSMWKARLRSLQGDWANLQLLYGLGADPWLLQSRAFGGAEQVVVIDTIRNLLRFEDENDNSEVAKKVNPWIASARASGKTLFMAHHMRKGSGQHGEGIAGGHALLGAFDIALELLRDTGRSNRRVLRPYCRLVSPPEVMYEMSVDGVFQLLGSPDAVSLAEVTTRILDSMGDEWLTAKELREALGDSAPSDEQVRRALNALANGNEIERDPPFADGSKRGATYRWRRSRE